MTIFLFFFFSLAAGLRTTSPDAFAGPGREGATPIQDLEVRRNGAVVARLFRQMTRP
jgi:hypothetical protein